MTEKILAIETATNACSVALGSAGQIVNRSQVGNNLHSKVLLDMVAQVLAEGGLSVSDLDAVAVGQGPGSFTGLRIGIGVAQGIAYGANCSMIGVSSLAALAQQALVEHESASTVLAGIDARMGEIYCAEFQVNDGLPVLKGQQQVLAPELITPIATDFCLAGNAWQEYRPRLASEISSVALPSVKLELPCATAVLAIAQHKFNLQELIEPSLFQPEYIRDNVAKKKGEQ